MTICFSCFMNTPAERQQCRRPDAQGNIHCRHSKSWQLGLNLGSFTSFQPGDLDLLKQYLDAHNYAYGRNITRAKAYDMVTRCQHGLPSYMKYSNAQLRTFINERRIPITGNINRMGSRQLVKCLEDADDTATFPLMRLPPELRAMIYEQSFEPVQRRSRAYAAPPILQFNKQVNNESQGLFETYKSQR